MRKYLIISILLSLTALQLSAAESAALPEGFPPPLQDVGGPELYSIEVPADPMIDAYIAEYSSEQGQRTMAAILNRGAPYLGFIYNRLVENQMPPELLYLPAIESGFRPGSVSRSGAAGLWQFMMNSIAPYEMEVNQWRDDRFDFWKATEAALDKLKYNYERTGSWPLAVAAYNCGLGRVERAVKASGSTDYIELYEQGYIPLETRKYVPKLFAFAHLATHPETENLQIAAILNTEAATFSDEWKRLELKQAVNLVILASKSGIPVNLLHEANSELRHGISPPADSGYFLKVPARYSDNVTRILAENRDPLMRFYMHEIRDGDTFYALSRHFGVPVSMIQMYNPGTDARSLRNGQTIIIPALKDTGPYRSDYSEPKQWSSYESYTVRGGDSLWGIAKKFSTTVEELAFNNAMKSSDTLKAGAVIKVPREE